MDDRVERFPAIRLSEDNRAEACTVKATPGVDDVFTELGHDARQARRARLHDFAGQSVGVDQDGAQLPQPGGHE